MKGNNLAVIPHRAIWAMYGMAARRKVARWIGREFDPYPAPPPGARLNPSERSRAACLAAPLRMSWQNAAPSDPAAWRAEARAKLAALTGWRRPPSPPAVRHSEDAKAPAGCNRRRFYLAAWPDGDIVVDVVWSTAQTIPTPAMLCLQGTNSGAHLSWGETRLPVDPVKLSQGLDFARQAASRGLVAVCIEQLCFGERRERALQPRSADPCVDAFHHALRAGRTLLGERMSDVSAVIDWLRSYEHGFEIGDIYALGHSSGGTTALHVTALDARIAGVIASGGLGPILDTIAARRDGAGQNTIPGILEWLELADVAALCAPRPLLAISGARDHIFPFSGVAKVVDGARAAYGAVSAADKIRAVEAPGGHNFYPALTWRAFDELIGQ